MDSVFRTDFTELQAQLAEKSEKWSIAEIIDDNQQVDKDTTE